MPYGRCGRAGRPRGVARRGGPFPLAILDLRLRGMDGLELARAIKADAALAAARLVMPSAGKPTVNPEVLRAAGIEHYLVRPIRQADLDECLAAVMGRGGHDALPKDAPVHSPRDASRRRPRILVAEDNLINQKVGLRLLQKLGHTADAVANGLEALEALQRISYDVVLMDNQMPEMDGYQAAQAIRNGETGAHPGADRPLPVYTVALTAHAMQ